MDAAGWRRRRRRATAAGLAMLAVLVAAGVALWTLDQWRWVLTLWFVPAVALQLLLLSQRRPSRLLARLATVLPELDRDATATVVAVDERQAAWWLGLRGWGTSFLVLADDPRGFALWDVRRGRPIEVMRCGWGAVAGVEVRDGGARVELLPAASGDPIVRLVPTGFRDDPPRLMQTPSRALAFTRRIRERLHAFDPLAHPSPQRRADDADRSGDGSG